jgi:hypothetical protein
MRNFPKIYHFLKVFSHFIGIKYMTSIVYISLMETQKDRDFKVVTIPSIPGYKITKVARGVSHAQGRNGANAIVGLDIETSDMGGARAQTTYILTPCSFISTKRYK